MKKSRPGFALLFVYAMAATIAIMLFMAMPRVAFEAQRDKEQLLIDRGEQYSRAILLFARRFNRFPSSIDDLRSTQNLRFLRKTYVDPFTGKDEWRLIHAGPGGLFTDSLVYNTKKIDPNAPQQTQQTFITEMQQIGGNPVDPNSGATVANQANRDAIRDSITAQTAGLPPGQLGQPTATTDPNGNAPGLATTVNPAPPTNNFPPMIGPDGRPVTPTSGNVPGSPQNPVNLPPGVAFPPGVQLPPGIQQPGFPQPNGTPNAAATTAAANMINQILTTPRPGGLPGMGNSQTIGGGVTGGPTTIGNGFGATPGATTTSTLGTPANGQPAQQQVMGGGIAGIASKVEQQGIKRYRDKKKYNEWEFVYDVSKDKTRTPQLPQAANQQPGSAVSTSTPPSGSAASGTSSNLTGSPSTGTTTMPTPSPIVGVGAQ
jgi:hypothetical protein